MANLFLHLLLLSTSFAAAAAGVQALRRGEKLTHLRFFWHDVVAGPNATAVPVTQPPPGITASSSTHFGMVVVIDNAMTVEPEIRSKPVGRAQGFYLMAAQRELALLMTMNLVFTDGEYSGSTLAVVGRDQVLDESRELSVVGGSGFFRLARGYAELKTYSMDAATKNAVVEYNVSVFHA